jgi:hypothetical protein
MMLVAIPHLAAACYILGMTKSHFGSENPELYLHRQTADGCRWFVYACSDGKPQPGFFDSEKDAEFVADLRSQRDRDRYKLELDAQLKFPELTLKEIAERAGIRWYDE